MTFISVTQANSRTAEFARLFDLFDRVARARTRLTGDSSEVISADDIANVPAEFAPVLKGLSTILSSRARHNEEHSRRRAQSVSMTNLKQRHHSNGANLPSVTLTVEDEMPPAGEMEPPKEAEENIENPSFPPDRRYPFTFKLMLHKLYDLDEWAEKVKSAVETSKLQFKPLAERVQNVVWDTSAGAKDRGVEKRGRRGSVQLGPVLGASAKFKPPSTTRQVHSGARAMSRDATTSAKERGEKRSNVRPVLGASAKFKPPSAARHPRSAATPVKPEASRVLKKRCVGRRKSIDGPMSTGVWVYDAAISAIEVAGPRPAVEITLSAPRGQGAGGATENRHRSLTELETLRARDTSQRKIKITVPLLQEESAESTSPQPGTGTERGMKKRRSIVPSFASESCKRLTVKRPLCV